MLPLVVVFAGLIGAALAGVAVYFWLSLMRWSREHLLPKIDQYLPGLASSVRLAFQVLDDLAVELRRAVRTAWRELRHALLSEVAEFVEDFNGDWHIKIVSYLRMLERNEEKYVQVVTTQEVPYDSLPDDVRVQALANKLSGREFDLIKMREEEIDQKLRDTN